MNPPTLRILFGGERWLGSDSGGCLRALRRLGHEVVDLDNMTTIPFWRSFSLRAARRLLFPLLLQEYNRNLLGLARQFEPEIFFAFQGAFVLPATLEAMRKLGIKLYNYYPDISAFGHGVEWLPQALQVYDCVFSTKSFLAADLAGFQEIALQPAGPFANSLAGVIRVGFWKLFTLFFGLYNLVEVGLPGEGIYTRVFLCLARKPAAS